MNHRKPKLHATGSLLFVALLALLGLQGCQSLRDPKEALAETKQLELPARVDRPVRQLARRFGEMYAGYSDLTEPLVVEIALIPNDSGVTKDLPRDLGQYVLQAISDIGPEFADWRSSNPAVVLDTMAAQAQVATAAQEQSPPKTRFKITGSLMRMADRVVKAKDLRGDALFKLSGMSVDGQGGSEDRVTFSSVRVSLNIEGPDRLTRSGDVTTVEIFVLRREDSSFAGFYIAGTGVGGSSRVEASQDVGDALYDITVRCLVQILGNTLTMPYWRLDPWFAEDPTLVEQFRSTTYRKTNEEREALIKRYLIVSGLTKHAKNRQLDPDDRLIVRDQMRQRGIAPDSPTAEVELCVDLWRKLDFDQAARIRRQDNDDLAREKNAQATNRSPRNPQSAATANATSGAHTPQEDFNFPPGTEYLVIDVTRMELREIQVVIEEIMVQPWHVQTRKATSNRMVFGTQVKCGPPELTAALRRHPLLADNLVEFVWTQAGRRLTLAPKSRR